VKIQNACSYFLANNFFDNLLTSADLYDKLVNVAWKEGSNLASISLFGFLLTSTDLYDKLVSVA